MCICVRHLFASLSDFRSSEHLVTSVKRNYNSLALKPESPRGRRSRIPIILAITAITSVAVGWYGFGSNHEDDALNTTRFTAFNIVSKEQVSPTAFVLAVRCNDDVLAENVTRLKAAWEHGLWSVEMKQPQLQIARHYTPLPPLNGASVKPGELRFLIRKMDSGEMSNYLSRLQVGDNVWLRGPHQGFDISKRLGDAKDVVFLAGGTGIAPALQLAHKLLNGPSEITGITKPSIRILWANRGNVDSVAREELVGRAKGKGLDTSRTSSLTKLIVELKQMHGDHFNIDYFVDNERLVTLKDIDVAMVSDEEDSTQVAGSDCTCRSRETRPEIIGRNLVCVSGPDGFIEAYAGSKRWFGGREIQGPVQGLLGAIKRMYSGMDDWLVLKL
ncbi:hypothetical protein BJ170DRAFT_735913 [Xylariales sp. AK1849]|nr:hypothetical protein BJ170DRAFT_735913 [Xylariales sp. AK1849]